MSANCDKFGMKKASEYRYLEAFVMRSGGAGGIQPAGSHYCKKLLKINNLKIRYKTPLHKPRPWEVKKCDPEVCPLV